MIIFPMIEANRMLEGFLPGLLSLSDAVIAAHSARYQAIKLQNIREK